MAGCVGGVSVAARTATRYPTASGSGSPCCRRLPVQLIVAPIAVDVDRDRRLCILDAGHLFAVNVTRLGLRWGSWLRGYVLRFIESFVSTLTRQVIERTVQ